MSANDAKAAIDAILAQGRMPPADLVLKARKLDLSERIWRRIADLNPNREA